MARNGSGTYVVPNTFVSGAVIAASGENENFSDIGAEITNSLPRDGQAGMIGQFKAATGTLALPSISFTAATSTGIYKTATGFALVVAGVQIAELTATGIASLIGLSGLGTTPIGGGMDFWGSTAPAGWLFPYGQAVSRTTYASLFAVLGTQHGIGDGSTTFNLPDKRGRLSIGKDDMGGSAASRVTTAGSGVDGTTLGASGGAQTVALVQANLPNVSFTNSGIAAAITNGTVAVPAQISGISGIAGGVGVQGVSSANSSIGANSGAVGVSITSQGSASSGGSGTAINKLPPGIVCNSIIYAGA